MQVVCSFVNCHLVQSDVLSLVCLSQEHVFWVVSLNTLFIMVFGKSVNF